MQLGEYLKLAAIRDDAFAALIGRDRSTVNRIRRGEIKPDWDTVARIQEATGGAVTAMDFVPAAPELREAV
jgi:DNA-binding transcriptional regulator YdaS (Cro superfamily)